MCGIAGSINFGFDEKDLELIKHRGPDSTGYYNIEGENKICLGQTRLSIVDLSDAGYQPMVDATKKYVLVFNGEVYNHLDLRKELTEYSFAGHSDTETILYFLIKFGKDGIKRLNGIFSIAFFDLEKQKALLIRDPFGIKPLYYYFKNNALIFASETKFINQLLKQVLINKESIYNFLRIRSSPSNSSLFTYINKIRPGHFLEFSYSKEVEIIEETFYSYKPKANSTITYKQALDKYEDLVIKAVERQLMSDVPLSLMLSGGIDSALLLYFIQEISKKKIDTYTLGYNVIDNSNELQYAKYTANKFGSNHHEIIVTEEQFIEDSFKVIDIIEEPVSSQSIVPFYHLTKKIREDKFKVAFSGQGVDEGMAGYARYQFQDIISKLASPNFKYLNFTAALFKNDSYRRGLNAIKQKDRLNQYIESFSFFDKKDLSTITHFQDVEINVFEHKFYQLLNTNSKIYTAENEKGLDYMLQMDIRGNLSDDLLLYTDKISMYNSVEVRVPFLDIELMEFIESLPNKFKRTISTSKILHKDLAKRYLPEALVNRKKNGFYTPRKIWFKSVFGLKIKEEIENSQSLFFTFVNKAYFLKIIKDHMDGQYNYENQIFTLLNLFYFFKSNHL